MWHRVAGALRGGRVLELYTDGSAEERVGKPGGWAFLVVCGEEVLASKSGASASTTSLVMELEAALEGLREIVARGWHTGASVELISDSSIALDIAAGRFLPKRQVSLALALRAAAVEARATTRWVRAHSGHPWNEAVDSLADQAKRGS
ncbi:MAG: RNase H family protein [Archangium sp.]|nr:RNase H family protein [Archangium sp.]